MRLVAVCENAKIQYEVRVMQLNIRVAKWHYNENLAQHGTNEH